MLVTRRFWSFLFRILCWRFLSRIFNLGVFLLSFKKFWVFFKADLTGVDHWVGKNIHRAVLFIDVILNFSSVFVIWRTIKHVNFEVSHWILLTLIGRNCAQFLVSLISGCRCQDSSFGGRKSTENFLFQFTQGSHCFIKWLNLGLFWGTSWLLLFLLLFTIKHTF